MDINSTKTDLDSNGDHEAVGETFSAAVHATDMRELSSFLGLMIDQIGMILQESEESVGDLIESITKIAASVGKIEQQLPELDNASKNTHDNAAVSAEEDATSIHTVSTTIKALCSQTEHNMQKAVTAFQFYDRLSQRILHIQENLQAVSDVTRAQDNQHPELWQRLHEKMRSVYTLEQEQRLYWALLKRLAAEGLSSEDMENKNVDASSGADNPSSYGDIELF